MISAGRVSLINVPSNYFWFLGSQWCSADVLLLVIATLEYLHNR